MRPVATLAAASLVLVAACTDEPKQQAIPADPTTTVTRLTATTLEEASPVTAANGEPLADDHTDSGDYVNGHHLALLTSADVPGRRITVDAVLWLSGDAASKAYAEDNNGDEIDGEQFYVRNQNKLLRTFTVAKDAVVLRDPVADNDREHITLAQFVSELEQRQGGNALVGITLKNGVVTRIEAIYTP